MFTREASAEFYHAQSACYTCGRVEDVINTDVQIEGEGVLAICTNCVAEMNQVAENVDEVETMARLTGDLTRERDDLVKLVRKLRREIRELKTASREA
ncbi:MAG TPA: hypothetical protein VNM39_15255, partial [Verrucomicrobiae bacterium]|nr:hypothetical protein [Verrucomicrobiae bacterium]